MWYLLTAQGIPPEIAGFPTWVLNGLSVGGLVMLIIFSLFTDRLWTKGQVNRLIEQHKEAMNDSRTQHSEALAAIKERYETHITRTVDLWRGRAEDAIRREEEWKDIALKWQKVSELLGDAIDPLHAQSATTLEIVRQLQAYQQANPPRRRQP